MSIFTHTRTHESLSQNAPDSCYTHEYMKVSYHIYKWVFPHTHVQMSHSLKTLLIRVTHEYEWVTPWMSHATLMNEYSHTHQWVMSHVQTTHVTLNRWATLSNAFDPCHTHEWVMSHVWMSHVTHTNESCHTYEWVMSHAQISHVRRMNESCHTHEWVLSYIWMSHVAHTNQSHHTWKQVM